MNLTLPEQIRGIVWRNQIKMMAIAVGGILLAGVGIVTAIVEAEANYNYEVLGEEGQTRALILFHPSREAHFSDDLSLALAEGLRAAGFSVYRAPMTRNTPAAPKEYALIAIVSNTYWWTPDLPTLRYLARARLQGVRTIGLIAGAGATRRSQRILDEALRKTGSNVMQTRSFWLFRPNDETRMSERNREVALQLAKQFGLESGKAALASTTKLP